MELTVKRNMYSILLRFICVTSMQVFCEVNFFFFLSSFQCLGEKLKNFAEERFLYSSFKSVEKIEYL